MFTTTKTRQVRVRFHEEDVEEIELEAKRRRLRTGDNITMSDVVREGVMDLLKRTEND